MSRVRPERARVEPGMVARRLTTSPRCVGILRLGVPLRHRPVRRDLRQVVRARHHLGPS